jgi:exodeoxyribonuclease VII large subunit
LVHPGQRIAFQRQTLTALDQRWRLCCQRWFEQQRRHLERQTRTLEHLNPRAILARGYALVQDNAGHVIDDATRLKPGDQVQLTLAHGTRHATILPEPNDPC